VEVPVVVGVVIVCVYLYVYGVWKRMAEGRTGPKLTIASISARSLACEMVVSQNSKQLSRARPLCEEDRWLIN